MRKVMMVLGALVFGTFVLVSCGSGSVEGDAKKIADLQCKAQQLMTKAASGDQSVIEEANKITKEAASLKEEIEKKYTSDSDKKKLAEALLKELGNCK